MEKISFCLTNFNRVEFLFRSFAQIIDDERIGEIIISDDASLLEIFERVKKGVEQLNNPKIKLFRNQYNQGVYMNKMLSVQLASNEYCVVADSDNIYGEDFLDRIYEKVWNKDVIFSPVLARPVFNFTHFSGITISKENIKECMTMPKSETITNLMNFFVNRNSYLEVFDDKHEPWGSDSIYFFYLWIKSGRKFYCMPNLQYTHEVHPGSNYVAHAKISEPMVFALVEKLKQLQ